MLPFRTCQAAGVLGFLGRVTRSSRVLTAQLQSVIVYLLKCMLAHVLRLRITCTSGSFRASLSYLLLCQPLCGHIYAEFTEERKPPFPDCNRWTLTCVDSYSADSFSASRVIRRSIRKRLFVPTRSIANSAAHAPKPQNAFCASVRLSTVNDMLCMQVSTAQTTNAPGSKGPWTLAKKTPVYARNHESDNAFLKDT